MPMKITPGFEQLISDYVEERVEYVRNLTNLKNLTEHEIARIGTEPETFELDQHRRLAVQNYWRQEFNHLESRVRRLREQTGKLRYLDQTIQDRCRELGYDQTEAWKLIAERINSPDES